MPLPKKGLGNKVYKSEVRKAVKVEAVDEKAEKIKNEKEKLQKGDVLTGMDFINLWKGEGNAISPGNEVPTEISCYSLVGHIFRDTKFPHLLEMGDMDNRLHFIWVQPQRTGKTRLMKGLLKPVCQTSNVGFIEQGVTTGAGAIGGSDPTSKGDLEMHFDKIHYFDEFMASIHSISSRGATPSELLDILRMAMNSDGKVRKKLSRINHNYVTRATLMLSTTPIDFLDLPKQAISGGFIGRQICFFRDISEIERRDMEQKFCKGARRISNEAKWEFLKTIMYFQKSIEEKKEIMHVSNGWRDVLASEVGKLRDTGGIFSGYLREGSVDKIIKLATIRAILFESSLSEQIPHARKFEQQMLNISGSFMDLSFGDVEEALSIIVALLRDNKELSKYEMTRKASVFRKNQSLLDKCILKATREGIISMKMTKRAKRYYLKDGVEYLQNMEDRNVN
jgi:hypothetical protein